VKDSVNFSLSLPGGEGQEQGDSFLPFDRERAIIPVNFLLKNSQN
jgi:hypothetical protein